MIPHTLVLKPGLVIHRIYNGYWFWGRPSVVDLWRDLRDCSREIRPDWDLSTPGAARCLGHRRLRLLPWLEQADRTTSDHALMPSGIARGGKKGEMASTEGRVVSVNVGKPRTFEFNGHHAGSAIWKSPVVGRVAARGVNLEGDDQADRKAARRRRQGRLRLRDRRCAVVGERARAIGAGRAVR
jgi:hypothetical protein